MIKRKAETITAEELRKSYVDNIGATVWTASSELRCSYHQFRKALELHGFKPKPKTRNWKRKSQIPQLSDHEWLRNELQTKTIRQIAKELGTSVGNVADRIYRYKIQGKALNKSLAVREAFRKRYPNGRRGEKASRWKGGRRKGGLDAKYILVFNPDHPQASKEGYVMEHRVVMEKHLGRYLRKGEYIHHKNGDPHDNRLKNLQLVSRKEHARIHSGSFKEIVKLKQEISRLKQILDKRGGAY